MKNYFFIIRRELRNIRDFISYLNFRDNKNGPDNHYYKVARIIRYGKKNKCNTLIETGTFYGQTVQKCYKYFDKTLSVELHDELYYSNQKIFEKYKQIKIFKGDSGSCLKKMIDSSVGNIIFWLDGHYSGKGTAIGVKESPILEELSLIKESGRTNDCILIDDVRLFTGNNGYPTIDHTKKAILSINQNYIIYIDKDCLIAEL